MVKFEPKILAEISKNCQFEIQIWEGRSEQKSLKFVLWVGVYQDSQ